MYVLKYDSKKERKKYQFDLVAVCTQWDSCFIVVLFTSQWNVTRSTLETTVMVCPIQGLDCWFRQCHRFTAEAAHICIRQKQRLSNDSFVVSGSFLHPSWKSGQEEMLSYLYSPCLCLGHFCIPIGTICLDYTQWRVRLVSPLNIKHTCGCKRELEAIVFCARRSGQKKTNKSSLG